jgi:predicted DNA-binding transcriptional regulator AlpA
MNRFKRPVWFFYEPPAEQSRIDAGPYGDKPVTEEDIKHRDTELIRLREVARRLDRAPDTVRDWCRRGLFPAPIRAVPGGPLQWRPFTIADWIDKRARSRSPKPAPRGKLRRGAVS